MDKFRNGRLPIVVATDLAARGLGLILFNLILLENEII